MSNREISKNPLFYKKLYNPLLVSNLLACSITVLSDLVDQIMAGQFIGEQGVAAVGISGPLYIMICFFAYIISIGAPVLYSRTYGEFELDKAYKIFGSAMIASLAIGVFSAAFLKFITPAYYAFYGASPELTVMAQDYFKYFFVVAIVYPANYLLFNMVYQDGDPFLCMLANIVQMITNIIVSWVLLTRLGIMGLGIGTVCGYITSTIVLCVHFFKKSNALRMKFGIVKGSIRQSISLGLYSSLTWVLSVILCVTMNKYIISSMGEIYLPAYTALAFLTNFSTIFCAFATAIGPLVGVYYGEKNYVAIKRMMNDYVMKITYRAGIICSIVMFLLAKQVPLLYGITTPEVFTQATIAVRLGAIALFILALNATLSGYYSIIGQAVISAVYTVCAYTVFPLIAMIGLGSVFGMLGFWMGYPVAAYATQILLYAYVIKKYGKKNCPLILDDNGVETHIIDTILTKDSIIEIRNQISDYLQNKNVCTKSVKQAELMIEEVITRIIDENEGQEILAEFSVLIDEKNVRIIIKDTGKIFDITDSDAEMISFNAFVLAAMMQQHEDKIYATTSGYNRNSFTYDR